MVRYVAAGILTGLLLASSASIAQENRSKVPPQNALKLSEIVAKVEQRNDFHYVSEIDWSEEGYYDVIYFTGDKAKVEIKIDAVTGEPR